MAGSDQRPTDEVLGHGYKKPEDETAGGGDRGSKRPHDVEGHMPLRRLDTEAIDEDQVADDTQGHGRYWQDAEAVDEDQAGDDDTGGHVAKLK